MSEISLNLSDKMLIKSFKESLDNAKFITRKPIKKKIKENLKVLLELEIKIEERRSKQEDIGFISKELQSKIDVIHKLWELLIKEAIYCLRDRDSEDVNAFKQDFGIIEVKEYFEKFSKFEEVLYGTDRYYRDHSLHVFRVFLLGFHLLNHELYPGLEINIIFKSIEIPHSVQLKNVSISPEEKQAIWTLIALSHDLGYPLEKIDKINDKIRKIIEYYGPSGIEEFKYHLPLQNQILNDFILKFISSKLIQDNTESKFLTVIQNKYYLKFAKAFENFSHGIMSCILLMKHLVYFKESDYSHSFKNPLDERDAKQFLIRKTILRCIASHDNEDIYHIQPNNFSFLLTICDNLQEWDRPRITHRFEHPTEVIINNFSMNEISYEIQFQSSEVFEFSLESMKTFARMIRKYIKLFRSGPKSEKRPFTFILSLSIKKNSDTKFPILLFNYQPNTNPEVYIPLIKNEKNNYLESFLNFIENGDDSEEIINLVKSINNNLKEKF